MENLGFKINPHNKLVKNIDEIIAYIEKKEILEKVYLMK